MELEDEVVKTPVTEETPLEVTPEEATPVVQPGDKTEPNLLLKSLQDEREKRRLAEEEKRLLEEQLKINSSTPSVSEAFSDEGKLLESNFNKQISELKSELTKVTSESLKKDVLTTYPILKEKWEDFETFQSDPENKGMSLKTAAKAFLVENELLGTTRKGLEKPTGGTRTPAPSGMTAADVKTLRETDFKKYQEMLIRGEIKITA